MYRWTRLGEPVDPGAVPVLRPVPDAAQSRPPAWHRPKAAERLAIRPVRVVEEIEDEVTVWVDPLPPEAHIAGGLPDELSDWAMSKLARTKADEANINALAVLMTAALPQEARRSDRDDNIWLYSRGDITAVVCPNNQTILTVFRNREGTPSGYRAG